MKQTHWAAIVVAALVLFPVAHAGEADREHVLGGLLKANKEKNPRDVLRLTKAAAEIGTATRDTATRDTLAEALTNSLKAFKNDHEVLMDVVDTLGVLRSKRSKNALRRLAFRRKVSDPAEQRLQARSLIAIARLQDPGLIDPIAKQTKARSVTVATAAYKAFASYATARGRIRKRVVETLIKRLELEYPAYSNSAGKYISDEKLARWSRVAPSIVASLGAVARQPTIHDVADWRLWWRENKKARTAWTDDK